MTTPPKQRVAVITGASSGIGKEAAKSLVEHGWRVIGLGRNSQRCYQAREDILQLAAAEDQVQMICADLALMTDTKRAALAISALTDRVDALLNNAGGLTAELTLTSEGNENTFASNHLGHFLLTNCLLSLLRKTAAASAKGAVRVVNVSSAAHAACEGLDWDDLQSVKNFVSMPAYCRAKLANLLFTGELAKRLSGEGVAVHAMHPGLVASNFFNHGDDAMKHYLDGKEDVAVTPQYAADTLVWLATAPEPGNTSGEYFFERKTIDASPPANDPVLAKRLWHESEALVSDYL